MEHEEDKDEEDKDEEDKEIREEGEDGTGRRKAMRKKCAKQ